MDTKEKTGLVEESITIKISDFGKKLLYATYNGEANPTGIKQECFNIKKNGRSLLVSYTYEPLAYMDTIDLTLTHPDGRVNYQMLNLDWAQLHFGLRPYFVCSCGRRCERLYMAQHKFFYCRCCQNLAYESTRVKKTSLRGFAYPMLRLRRLMERETKVKRISYNGRMTKKASALVSWTKKTGGLVSHLRLMSMDSQRI